VRARACGITPLTRSESLSFLTDVSVDQIAAMTFPRQEDGAIERGPGFPVPKQLPVKERSWAKGVCDSPKGHFTREGLFHIPLPCFCES
jgi:hypothetical protein